MAANKHASALSLENEKMASFATKPKPNPLALMSSTLAKAAESPDIRPGEQGKVSDLLRLAHEDPAGVDKAVEPDTQVAELKTIQDRMREQSPEARPQSPVQTSAPKQEIIDDGASYSVASRSDEPNRGGRPRHGAERKVERTVCMDKTLDKMLERLSIIESVRLDRKVSTAEVAVHLMRYGLSHATNNQVLPGPDGLGLQITTPAPTSVSLPKLGGEQA
jgi:hypothetical protein